MYLTRPRPTLAKRSHDAQLVAVADRLVRENANTPIIDVVHAVVDARRELRDAGVVPVPPDLVAARARAMLSIGIWQN